MFSSFIDYKSNLHSPESIFKLLRPSNLCFARTLFLFTLFVQFLTRHPSRTETPTIRILVPENSLYIDDKSHHPIETTYFSSSFPSVLEDLLIQYHLLHFVRIIEGNNVKSRLLKNYHSMPTFRMNHNHLHTHISCLRAWYRKLIFFILA